MDFSASYWASPFRTHFETRMGCTLYVFNVVLAHVCIVTCWTKKILSKQLFALYSCSPRPRETKQILLKQLFTLYSCTSRERK